MALALSLALWYALRSVYDRFLLRAGAEVLSISAGIPAEELIIERDGRFAIDTGLYRQSGRPLIKPLPRLYSVHWNWVLFLWGCGLIPFAWWRRVWWGVLGGVIVLAATHVGYFAASTFGQIAALYSEHGMEPLIAQATLWWLAVGVQAWSVLLDKIAPFALLAPVVWLGRRPARTCSEARTRRPAVAGGRKVGRNEPCPCGSGRKFKNCCAK